MSEFDLLTRPNEATNTQAWPPNCSNRHGNDIQIYAGGGDPHHIYIISPIYNNPPQYLI